VIRQRFNVSYPQLSQLNSCLQLTGATVKIRSCSGDAAMPSKRFQDVYRCAFVGKVREERPAPTVAASTFKSSAFVEQFKLL